MRKLLLATKNKNKVREVKEIFKNSDYEILSLDLFDDHDEVIEDGFSFEENAILKADYYFKKYHIPTIADDSGISISYLHDHPGIHSARFLGGNDYERTNAFLLSLMKGIQNRKAYYSCVIAYVDEEGTRCFEGILDGEIAHRKAGERGFGYDPIFYMPSYQKTLAELEDSEKNKISHRYIALRKLVEDLEK